jgi:hypothetical protein
MSEGFAEAVEGAACTVPREMGPDGSAATIGMGLLDGGCCSDADGGETGLAMGPRARRARAAAGVGFLLLAGAMSSRRLPGGIALWPAAVVPTWFGVSHLVSSVTGYRGCPELGAIPSVLLGRPIGTNCGPWERFDRRIEPETAASACRDPEA